MLEPGENIAVPALRKGTISDLMWHDYGIKSEKVKRLNSYDDQNYHIWPDCGADGSNPCIAGSLPKDGLVLKITNSKDTIEELLDGQCSLLEHVWKAGFCVQRPITNKSGQKWSIERLPYETKAENGNTEGYHAVRLLTYIPGKLLLEAEVTPPVLYQVGQYLGKLHLALKAFRHPAFDKRLLLWSLDEVPQVVNFADCLEDDARISIISEIVKEFKSKILDRKDKFPKSQLHGDFNEQNILTDEVDGAVRIIGVLDFGDSTYSCRMFDLAIAVAYSCLVAKDADPVTAGGHVIAGYLSAHPLLTEEFLALRTAICARLAQSLVYGFYSFKLNPDNHYLLSTANKVWPILIALWETPAYKTFGNWQNVIRDYGMESLDFNL